MLHSWHIAFFTEADSHGVLHVGLGSNFNNLFIILGAIQNSGSASGTVGVDHLTFNQFLPYPVMLGIVSVIMFVRPVIRKNRFLRKFSIVLYIIMLIKLFAIDLANLSAGARTTVFMVPGLFLIGFAFVYPRLLKSDVVENERLKK